jgi:hypothetical protein
MALHLAQIVNPVLPGSLGSGSNEQGTTAIGTIIGNILGIFLIFAFIMAFLYLLLGGFDWITSGGDKSKLESARNKITNALIGLIVVAATWAVMSLVGQFVGISFPDLPFPTMGG